MKFETKTMIEIVELDANTKALQIASSSSSSGVQVQLGSIANCNLFLRYNGRMYVGCSCWTPDLYEGGVLVSKRGAGALLHQTLEFICAGNNHTDRELFAFFDEFVADESQVALRVWIRTPYPVADLDHVQHLKFYALPAALLRLSE